MSGRIALCEKLIVEGTVESDLEGCRVLEVAGTGRFRGSVDVEIADIAGTLEGSVTASRVLTVRAGGVVRGDVSCGELVVERGATVAVRARAVQRRATRRHLGRAEHGVRKRSFLHVALTTIRISERRNGTAYSGGTVECIEGGVRYIPVETDTRSRTWHVVTLSSDRG